MENKKGISLIVLVITIMTMAIIVTSAISFLNQNNILDKAELTKFKTNYQDLKTELNTNVLKEMARDKTLKREDINATSLASMQRYMPSLQGSFADKVNIENGNLVVKVNELTKTELELVKEPLFQIKLSSSWDRPYIPMGFSHVEGTVDTGYVIREGTRGSEFVWIPVYDMEQFERVEFPSLNNYGGKLASATGLKDYDENFYRVYESVKKHGGFYVGRYETGISKGKYDEAAQKWTAGTLLIKKNIKPYSRVSVTTYKKNATDMYHRSDIQSSMMYAQNWDMMTNWIIKTNASLYEKVIKGDATIGHYSNSADVNVEPFLTGSKEEYKINNIYDIAGNLSEATLEIAPNSHLNNKIYAIERGGSYKTNSKYSIASRSDATLTVDKPLQNTGFRMMLYIK